jgi:hypothetical protein
VYIAYEDVIDIIDIYDGYGMVGNYSPVVADKLTQMRWTAKSFSFKNIRKITHVRTMGKYLIVGCDTGSI